MLSQESRIWMEVCAWQGVGHVVDVWGQFLGGSISAYVGRAYPAIAYRQGIGIAFKPVIILHISIRAVLTCLVCLKWSPEEQANLAVEKRQFGCSYGCWMSSPSGVC